MRFKQGLCGDPALRRAAQLDGSMLSLIQLRGLCIPGAQLFCKRAGALGLGFAACVFGSLPLKQHLTP